MELWDLALVYLWTIAVVLVQLDLVLVLSTGDTNNNIKIRWKEEILGNNS